MKKQKKSYRVFKDSKHLGLFSLLFVFILTLAERCYAGGGSLLTHLMGQDNAVLFVVGFLVLGFFAKIFGSKK